MKISLCATVVATLLACANAKWGDSFKYMSPKEQARTKNMICPVYAEQYASKIPLCSLNEWTEACLECSPPTDQEDLECYIDLGCMPAGATVGPRRLRRGRSLGEQRSFSGRSLRQVSGKCYFAQPRLCGRCGGNNGVAWLAMSDMQRNYAKPVVTVGCYHRLKWTSLRRNKIVEWKVVEASIWQQVLLRRARLCTVAG